MRQGRSRSMQGRQGTGSSLFPGCLQALVHCLFSFAFSFEFWFVALVRLFVDSTNVAKHIQSLAKYNHGSLRSKSRTIEHMRYSKFSTNTHAPTETYFGDDDALPFCDAGCLRHTHRVSTPDGTGRGRIRQRSKGRVPEIDEIDRHVTDGITETTGHVLRLLDITVHVLLCMGGSTLY